MLCRLWAVNLNCSSRGQLRISEQCRTEIERSSRQTATAGAHARPATVNDPRHTHVWLRAQQQPGHDGRGLMT